MTWPKRFVFDILNAEVRGQSQTSPRRICGG